MNPGTHEATSTRGLVPDRPLSRPYKSGRIEPSRLARFGTPRAWLRLRRLDGANFAPTRLRGLYPNAAPVVQGETREDEVLGSSDGSPRQAFDLAAHPVLGDATIEVQEFSGHRAEVEWAVLRGDILAHDPTGRTALRLGRDPTTRQVTAAWVTWRGLDDLATARPHDRVYAIDRALGRVVFGDDRQGRIPPPAPNGIVARAYRSGGGRAGNVPIGAVNQMLDSLPSVSAVGNPRPTSGGADDETLDVGPMADGPLPAGLPRPEDAIVRYLDQNPASAVAGGLGASPADLVALARSASSQVLAARAIRAGGGRTLLVVVPQDDRPPAPGSSMDPTRLAPSEGLKARIAAALAARLPGWAAAHVSIDGPATVAVSVSAVVEADPLRPDLDSGALRRSVESAMAAYLDPRTGGPRGEGWLSGGRSGVVAASDLARAVAGVDGVGRVLEVRLAAGGPPIDRIDLPPGAVAIPARDGLLASVEPTGAEAMA